MESPCWHCLRWYCTVRKSRISMSLTDLVIGLLAFSSILLIELPDDDIQAHRNPGDLDNSLENDAIKNLKHWYKKEYEFLALCKSLYERVQRNRDHSTARPSNPRTPRVVYIAGYGSSGSTLLDLLLGNATGVVGAGELWGIFRHFGSPVSGEPQQTPLPEFWQKVSRHFTDGMRNTDAPRTCLAARRRCEALQALPGLLIGLSGGRTRLEYHQCQQALFLAIQQASSCGVVVDSSKTARNCASRPLALAKLAGLDVRVIHLVRDGRAVLWSQMRRRNRRLEKGKAEPRLAWVVLCTLFSWSLANLVCWVHALVLPRGNVLRVKQCAILSRLGVETASNSFHLSMSPSSVLAGGFWSDLYGHDRHSKRQRDQNPRAIMSANSEQRSGAA